MSRPGQRSAVARPEIALKKAQNLIKVEKEQEALHTLYESLTSRRTRTSTDQMENVVMKFIDLCISNTKAKMAKEALMQYRNQCQQQQNVKSLEKVIKYYLEKAEKKADQAQKELDTKVAAVIDVDLEDDGSPEELMLSYVSKDNQENRTQRETVMPWFRFLWDSYRNMLDILRNNSKLEEVYAIVIDKAMTFCLSYARKQEFRRLCETLRNHLQQLRKQTGQSGLRDRSDLRNPNTFNLYVETRLKQLSVACSLESWDEAYRSAQDLQDLLYLVPKFRQSSWAKQWAQYYAKLTLVFSASTAEISKLYLAYSWIQLYQTVLKHIKGLPLKDYEIMANCVILSVLAVPPYVAITHIRDGLDEQQQKQEDQRMEQLALVLGINIDLKLHSLKDVVNRKELLKKIRIMNILPKASPVVREMYMLLEGQCNPIELCAKFQPLLQTLEQSAQSEDGEQDEEKKEEGENGKVEEPTGEVKLSDKNPIGQVRYGLYTSQLQKIAVLRVLKQLSGIYSVMTISRVTEIIPYYGFDKLERVIVDASKFRFLQVKIDHQNKTISFEIEGFSSEPVNNQLTTLAHKLDKLMPLVTKDLKQKKQDEINQVVEQAKERTEKEHERTLIRKQAIEKRKELAEKEILEKQRKEEEQMEALYKQQEEKRRIMLEQEEARRRAERELKEKQKEDIKMLESVIGKEKVAAKVQASPTQKVDRDQIIQEAQEEMIKSQEEIVRKLTRMVRQVDHLERARREKQRPIVQQQAAKYAEQDQQYFGEELDRQKEVHKAAWERDVKEKSRVARMYQDGQLFEKSVRGRRAEVFSILRKQHEAKMAKIRAERHNARLKQRKMAFVKRCRLDIENKIKEMEEEEKQRKEAEKRREQEEKRAKLEEIDRKKKEKEDEIERRRQQERESFIRQDTDGGDWQEVKKSANAYVPRHLRQQQSASAQDAPPSQDRWTRGGAPAAAAAATANGPATGSYRPPAARDAAPRDEEVRGRADDRWERSQTMPAGRGTSPPAGRGTSPPADNTWRPRGREAAPAAQPPRPTYDRESSSASSRWGDREPERPRAAPRAADRPERDSGAAPEPWRPKGRDRDEPPRGRDRDEPPREPAPRQPPAQQQPPSSGGGGGYVPPSRRGAAAPQERGGEGGDYVLPHMRSDDRGAPPRGAPDRGAPDPRDRRPRESDPRDRRSAGSASNRW